MISEVAHRYLLICALVCGAQLSAAESAVQQDQPEVVVRSVVDGVLLAVEANRDIHEMDLAPLRREIGAVLGDHVPFDRIAERVMGQHAGRATPAQRDRFTAVLADDLIRRHARTLVMLGPISVEVLSLERSAPDRALVGLRAAPDASTSTVLVCELALTEQGWVLQNISADERDLGVALEDRFAALLSMHDGSIDAVLDAWSGEPAAAD